MSRRLHYIDNLRVLVNFLIVLNHTVRNPYLTEKLLDGNLAVAEILKNVSMHFAPIRVPFFFFIAAVFSVTYLRNRGLRSFVRTRIHRIFIPLAIAAFSYVYIVVAVIDYKDPEKLLQPKAYMDYILNGFHGFSYLWFLYVLILFSVILAAGVFIGRGTRWGAFVPRAVEAVLPGRYALILLFFFLEGGKFLFLHAFSFHRELSLPLFPLYHLVRDGTYFLAGLAFGLCLHKQERILCFRPWEIGLLLASYLGLGFLGHLLQWKLAFLLYSLLSNFLPLLLLLVLFQTFLNRPYRPLAFIAGNTYTIYLIHFPVLCLTTWGAHTFLESGAGTVYLLTIAIVYPLSLALAVLIRLDPRPARIFGARPLPMKKPHALES